MPRRIEVAGRTIGRATVLGDAPRSRSGRCRVECKCSCGTGFVCDPRLLLNGQTTSCGCRHRESVTLAGALNGTHRMSRTTEYNTWIKIRDRCKNPRNVKFSDYGGRGISVCERWSSFENFLSDMGERPAGMSLDRIDMELGYSPENCKWSTTKEQARNTSANRRVTAFGQTKTLAEWS